MKLKSLAVALIATLFLTGCGGDFLNLPGLIGYNFKQEANNFGQVDLYIFENNGNVQSVANRTPTFSALDPGTTTSDFPLITGRYQFTLTSPNSSISSYTIIRNVNSGSSGEVRIIDSGSETALIFP